MELKLFKLTFWLGVSILLAIHIGPLFNLFDMSQNNLVSWSYYWVFMITYGGSGWLSYKKMVEQKSPVQMIPIITSCTSVVFLAFFLTVIFPKL